MAKEKVVLIVTSISAPNKVLTSLSEGAKKNNTEFIVIGDSKSPADFNLSGCDFYSLQKQKELDFNFAKLCPEKHYSRKNIGYLIAIQKRATIIIETDDDNFPREEFWMDRTEQQAGYYFQDKGWVNVYNYFSDTNIWPRGFPLEFVQNEQPNLSDLQNKNMACPIQQGLADENPDVDALYRLLFTLPVNFKKGMRVILGKNTVCPFNSQNTSFFKKAFPLLYLPSFCSFRMTDIWRSFVAQRICWENSWNILFHDATVYQERNVHNLLNDFADEISGYLNNDKIYNQLVKLSLKPGEDKLAENLLICYESLISLNLIDKKEINLIEAWNKDLLTFTKIE